MEGLLDAVPYGRLAVSCQLLKLRALTKVLQFSVQTPSFCVPNSAACGCGAFPYEATHAYMYDTDLAIGALQPLAVPVRLQGVSCTVRAPL